MKKAIPMLVVSMIYAITLLGVAYLGAGKQDIAIMTALFGGLLPVMLLAPKGKSGCCFRKAREAQKVEA